MTSPTSIVTGIFRKLTGGSDQITTAPQTPLTLSPSLPSVSTKLAWWDLLAPVSLAVVLLWAFAPTLAEMAHRWNDPQYSHGYLVPVFAVVLLWLRRDLFKPAAPSFSWWGIALLALGVLVRFVADYLYLDWLDAASILPCVTGLTLLLGGTAALRWAWPALGFLAFMIPLPFRLEVAMAHPLQRVATKASTYALQTLGFPALSEGNVILINQTKIGVVEACSGLSMLVIFFALSTAFAFVVNKPMWQRWLLIPSAVPIALIANITRITVTGVMHETVGHRAADLVFHDLAGWLMMPFALLILWLELLILGRIIVEVASTGPVLKSPVGGPMRVAPSKASKRRRPQKTYLPPTSHGPRQV